MYPIGIHFGSVQAAAGVVLWIGQILGGKEDQYTYLMWANLTGALLAVPILYFFYRRDEDARISVQRERTLQKGKAKELLLIFAMGAALAYYLNVILALVQAFSVFPEYSQQMENLYGSNRVWLMMLWSCAAAPVSEELVFRWLIYGRLREWVGRFWAALVSSLLFGIYHGNVLQFIYAVLMGLFLVLVMERTGNKYAPVAAHVGANLWSMILSYWGVQVASMAQGRLFLIILSIQFVVFMGGILYLVRKGKGETEKDKRG